MRNVKAEMFNNKAANPKNKPDQILDTLALREGQRVADIGAGGGYFSLRFAEGVGALGHVFAVDTNLDLLRYIEDKVIEKGLRNIEIVHVAEEALILPELVDLVFMRNVCHHIPNRVEYFAELKRILRPDGRIVIVEYRSAKRLSFRGVFGHYVPSETLMEEMNKAGYILTDSFDFLPEQSFTIYSLK
jgi:arsenite methyltransferase